MSYSLRHTAGLRRATSLAALLTAAALTVTACGSGDSDSGSASNGSDALVGDGNGNSAADAGMDKLKELYGSVLDNLNVDDFRDPDVTAGRLTSEFEYAVTDLNADQTPELLVQAKGTEFSSIRVYGASDDATTLVTPDKIFHAGAAGAGGSRMSVETTTDHSGLLATSGSAGNGQTETELWTFNDGAVSESGKTWNYRIDQTPADLTAVKQTITWTAVDDRSALDAASAGETTAADSGSGPQPTTSNGSGGTGGAGTSGATGGAGTAASSGGTLPQSMTASSTQIGGTCGTVDDATVKAGDSTSCGFAMAVAQQAMQPVYGPGVAPDPTVTGPAGTATITATSPTNGQTYTMTCNIGSDGTTSTCTGGNNATVWVTRQGHGSLTNLLN